MIDSSMRLEKFLQDYRFSIVEKYIIGDVLDFGGNNGELEKFVNGNYTLINYDHSEMKDISSDTIVCLAVIEHIEFNEVFNIFNEFKKILKEDGKIILTTPTKIAKPMLESLAYIGMLDKDNIEEHKYYWDKNEIVQ
jgi:cyclopropane fatty-acyl-phospholipid synthase-like methyltransferase